MPLNEAQAGLIDTGVNTAGNALSTLVTLNQYKKNREFNAREAAKARQFQLDMWNRQNAYDSPAAKMQRYIDAGLNPNLVYGQIGSLGNPLPSVSSAAGSNGGPVPSLNPNLDLVNAKLAQAQINNLNSKDDLNRAEAWKIYKISPVQFEQIQNDANLIRQKIESGSYVAAVEKFKSESFNDNRFFTIEDENGNLIVDDLKSLIIGNEFQRLYASDLDYQLAIKTFLNKVALSNFDLENARLSNKDLSAFVDVCARIYDSQAKQSDYLGAVAELNKEFFNDLGASSDVVKLIYGFLSLIIGGVSKFTPSRRRVEFHSNKYD